MNSEIRSIVMDGKIVKIEVALMKTGGLHVHVKCNGFHELNQVMTKVDPSEIERANRFIQEHKQPNPR